MCARERDRDPSLSTEWNKIINAKYDPTNQARVRVYSLVAFMIIIRHSGFDISSSNVMI